MAIETLEDIAEEMADKLGVYSEDRSNFVCSFKQRVRAAVEVERALDTHWRAAHQQPTAQPSVIHVCRTGCIDDNQHQWDGPEWVSEDGCANSATCSRCGMTAMHHSLMTAE